MPAQEQLLMCNVCNVYLYMVNSAWLPRTGDHRSQMLRCIAPWHLSMPYVMASVYPIVMLGALGVGRTEYETVDDP